MALDLGQNAYYLVYPTVKSTHLYSVTPISPRIGYGGVGKPITLETPRAKSIDIRHPNDRMRKMVYISEAGEDHEVRAAT
jgi:hypothetical protein